MRNTRRDACECVQTPPKTDDSVEKKSTAKFEFPAFASPETRYFQIGDTSNKPPTAYKPQLPNFAKVAAKVSAVFDSEDSLLNQEILKLEAEFM